MTLNQVHQFFETNFQSVGKAISSFIPENEVMTGVFQRGIESLREYVPSSATFVDHKFEIFSGVGLVGIAAVSCMKYRQFTLNERLISAISEGSLEKTREALQQGANPNYKKNGYWTPLRTTCEHPRKSAIAELLLNNGADPKRAMIQEVDGHSDSSSFLHFAAKNFSFSVIKLTVENGVDKSSKDKYGKTPFQWVDRREVLSDQRPPDVIRDEIRAIRDYLRPTEERAS